MATTNNIYKVKLVNASNRFTHERVTFDVSPDFTENRAVNYTPLEPVQAPGQIFIYKNTSSRTFDLGDVKLISRSQVEASKNMRNLQWIRSWTLPWFGKDGPFKTEYKDQDMSAAKIEEEKIESGIKETQKTIDEPAHENENLVDTTIKTGKQQMDMLREQTREMFEDPSKIATKASLGEDVGAPPAILYFSAYSSEKEGHLTHLNRIPVVIQNLSISYPSDVDFIPTVSLEPMPTIMSISISLVETHAPAEYNEFSLMQYKKGELPRF